MKTGAFSRISDFKKTARSPLTGRCCLVFFTVFFCTFLPLAARGNNQKSPVQEEEVKDEPAGELSVQFPVFKNATPNILSENRDRTTFALMRNEHSECFVSVKNLTKKKLHVLIVPIADSWYHNLKRSIHLKPQEKLQRQLIFGSSARCTGVRVYWLAEGMSKPEFRDFLCRDAGPLPRIGKVIDSIVWKTGKGPLKKTTLESLEDGRLLYEAFKGKNRNAFAGLIKAGADPNARVIDKNLCLDSVFQLICQNARNVSDFKSYLDLMMKNSFQLDTAICWNRDFPSDDADLPVIKYLFQHNLNPNRLSFGSIYPLESLLRNPVRCTSKMYALFFQNEADPDLSRIHVVEGKNGKKHLVREPRPSMLILAEGWLPDPDEEALKTAQTAEYFKILKMFLKAGAKPDAFRKTKSLSQQRTLAAENILHFLAKRTMTPAGLETIRLMLEAGANPNPVDFPAGNTPLFYLAKQDTVLARNAARLLIKAGADAQKQDAKKKTPADYAEGKMKSLLQHSHEKIWLEQERDFKR